MTIVVWVIVAIAYLIGGAIFAGLIELGNTDADLFAMVFWPIVAIFVLLLKITSWTSVTKHKIKHNIKYKHKEE